MPGDPFYKSKEWRRVCAEVTRRSRGWCEVPGCPERGKVVDHIVSRTKGGPDTAANARHLCRNHDNQVKEMPSGDRKSGGTFTVRGCDSDGWPLDPTRR